MRDTRRREPAEISEQHEPVFGFARTFLTWQFLVLFGETVSVSELFTLSVQDIDSTAPRVIGLVAAMLEIGVNYLDVKSVS